MDAVDFILNLAGLCLWLAFCSRPWSGHHRPVSSVFVSTSNRLRGPEKKWSALIGLCALLVGRAFFYWMAGSESGWTPKLNVGVLAIPFRSYHPLRMLAFSVLSFAYFWLLFYFSLILLTLLNRRSLGISDPVQRWIHQSLGSAARWNGVVLFWFPFLCMMGVWLLLSPILEWAELTPIPGSWLFRLKQAMVVGLGAYLSWKYVALVILVLSLVNNYVYLGNWGFWNFADLTAKKLLKPIPEFPPKFDLRPALGIAVVILVGWRGTILLSDLYERWAAG